MKFGRSERGTALVEFALVLPIMIVLTVTVVDFARAFYEKNVLATAAREGVRYLAMNDVAQAAEVEVRVRQVAAFHGVNITDVDVEDIGNKQMQVTATSEFDWLYPGLLTWLGATFTDPMPLSATATMREQG